MAEKRKVHQIVSAGVVILLGLLVLSAAFPRRVSLAHNLQSKIPVGEIYGGIKAGQTFVAEFNNLSCIEIMLATLDRKNRGNFFFYLRNGVGSDDDIFKYQGKMEKVKNNTFFRFSFPKIKDSKGKKYYFFIAAPDASLGNAITIWSSSKDLYKGGQKISDGNPAHGDLVFKTEYELNWRLSLEALVKRLRMIGGFFVRLFQNKFFYFVLFLLGFIWGLITLIQKENLFQRKGGFWAVFGFVLVAVLVWIVLLFSKKIVVYNSYLNTYPVGEIYGEKKIGQTFTAAYDDLLAVDVLMANYRRKVTGEIIFHLKEVGASNSSFQTIVDTKRIKDNHYFRYKFPEIEDSKGKSYYFYFEAPKAKPGNALTIWANDEDKYFEGEKIVNGKPAEGDLVFKTVYDLGLRGNMATFLNEITQNKPSPLNKKSFYIVLILLFVFSCALFVTALLKFCVSNKS